MSSRPRVYRCPECDNKQMAEGVIDCPECGTPMTVDESYGG